MLSSGQITLLIVSLLGLMLNITVGSIVSIGLRLISSDLILIAVICVVDIVLYTTNILRVILTSTSVIIMDKDSWNPAPIWWCPLDETITMACLTSSVELVAILSLMRYIKICKQKEINPYFYYGLACFSVIASISLALGNVHYGIYKWSFTDMFCLPVLNNENEGPQNQIYYYAFFAIYVARLMLSLVIITFCYIKVTTAYRRALKTSIAISMDHQNRVESNVYLETKSCESVQIPSPEPDSISAMEKFKLKRALTTFKLLGATFAYVLCFMPDIILTILDLTIAPDYDVGPAILVNALVCSSGIVSGFFVLFSHQHCRSYFFHFINSIFRSIGLAS